ncbi:TBC1 domain family member 28-like [Ochotona princeps]|uniref:TBC1 domain family member 28-like n=1 Tax=Ochotona princeps TaxID=9978 RepID=UPI002714FF70|nr:TBC1 domain family member 28-like [Ochotona princeps]
MEDYMDPNWSFDRAAVRIRRASERDKIFCKYEEGPRRGPTFYIGDEDEDSDDLIPDKFGFLTEKSLSCDSTLGTKQRRIESRRLGKWVKMLKNHSKYRDSEKFHRRFFKGIPSQVRGKVWMLILDVDKMKAQNPGKFKELKDQARRQSGEVYHIDSAVRGTFRDHLMFREQYGIKQQDLFGVLMAYSMYSPVSILRSALQAIPMLTIQGIPCHRSPSLACWGLS